MCEVIYHIHAKTKPTKQDGTFKSLVWMGPKTWLCHILKCLSNMASRGSGLTSSHVFSALRETKCFHNCHRLSSQSQNKIVLSVLCISNRLCASISDLCCIFEISPISNLPALTHWDEHLVSLKWQNCPVAFSAAAQQRKMQAYSYRWVNNSTGDIQARRAFVSFFSPSSDSAACFEVKCSKNLVLLLSQAFMPLKRVIYSFEMSATIFTSLLYRIDVQFKFVSSKLKTF